MGVSPSSGKPAKKEKEYRPPDVRAKDRFDTSDGRFSSDQNDSTVDKFDYLIVFRLTELTGKRDKSADNDDTSGPSSGPNFRISWHECEHIWRHCFPGTDEAKDKAVEQLAIFWENRTGLKPKPRDQVLEDVWGTIAREAIIDGLLKRSRLQLKLTADRTFVYCRIRAPIKELEYQADRENYRLQFRGEIDPGSEKFWNLEIVRNKTMEPHPVELENEKIKYSKDEANAILERLYKAGKIPPSDLTVFSEYETEWLWSLRVHALERIADKVPVYNKFPAYSAFTLKPHLRYLFQTYPSCRGWTLFRCKDRLYLTKSLLDTVFDFESFQERGVIDHIIPLHDANRGDHLTVDMLMRRWVMFWRGDAKEVGSAMLTEDAYEEDVEIYSFLERPFAQPLSDVREYFGEKLALYFAWLGHYTLFLTIPAALGLSMLVVFEIRGYWFSVDNVDWYTVGFVVMLVIWSAFYVQDWGRQCSAIALKWGTRGYEEAEKPRPQFRGQMRRSLIDNTMEQYYPETYRMLWMILNFFIVFFIILLNAGVVALVFYGDYVVQTSYPSWELSGYTSFVALVLAILIPISNALYAPVARTLNFYENHRTETDYEDALIKKALFFDVFNYYGALLFTAFGKGNLLGTCYPTGGCVYDLVVLLYAIFIVRFALSIFRIVRPIVVMYLFPDHEGTGTATVKDMADEIEMAALNDEPDDSLAFVKEASRSQFYGIFTQYEDTIIQFGYVNLFSVVLPFLPIIALVENMIKIRVDAWVLCSFVQRPHVQIVEDVGTWSDLMQLVSFLGVVSSAAILCFTEKDLDNYTTLERVIIFLSAEEILILLKIFVFYIYDEESPWVEECAARNAFVEERYAKGYNDDVDSVDFSAIRGHLDDNIDMESAELYDFRKWKKPTSDEYVIMEGLETKRRDLMRELRAVKDQLQTVYKTETFNDNTGIGETKHGLPLGRLMVKIVSLNFPSEEVELARGSFQHGMKEQPFNVQVRVLINATRQGMEAGPPLSDKSLSKIIELVPGNIIINQNMGPYAPIKTQDANVIFEIVDMRPNMDKSILGSTSIRLRELQDQASRDMVLHLKLRHEDTTQESKASLYVTLQFQYSKVVPIRNRIYSLQERLRGVERELTRLRVGRPKVEDEV